jgi:formate/nitrite transporter FocA (FNT family)
MGFSFVAEALLSAHLPDAPWRPLISRLGYCVGFLIVILGRQQLFTKTPSEYSCLCCSAKIWSPSFAYCV